MAITVEIEDGCVEHIEMKEGDSAEAVAIKFCQDHNLPDQFVALLTEHIVSNIISIRYVLVVCKKILCHIVKFDIIVSDIFVVLHYSGAWTVRLIQLYQVE